MSKATSTLSTVYRHSSNPTPYNVPKWARSLQRIPKNFVELAKHDSPIHEWRPPGVPDDVQLYIKRDDMTGSTLSGNKVRKLEFLLADALHKGCKHIITCGGLQSNFCRATAVAAAQLGCQTHLVLRTDIEKPEEVECNGNIFLNRLCGAEMYLVPKQSPYLTTLKPMMERIAQKLKAETGEASYIMTVGGSTSVGLFGYITAFQELISQGVQEYFDDIVVTVGSGGTSAGLAIANYLTGGKLKIHAVAICDSAAYFHNHVNETLQEVGLNDIRSEDILDIIEGYKGLGYGISTPEELDFITQVSQSTGIMLDPVYTGKGARGMLTELGRDQERFQGKRVLFIHTGGVFGLYDGAINSMLKTGNAATNRVHMYKDIFREENM
ncbi:uncharacterized protein LOC135494484 [Lineus longissimus]|uniref:uncharacterized protein LOC135494484 n=1 Tax=Lineus longissimus TaxID=88925 RepID=UPI002B4EF72B